MSGVTEEMIASAKGSDATAKDEPSELANNIATAKAMAGHVSAAFAAEWLTRQVPGITLEEAADHLAGL
jgi:hypothetical protein